MTQPMNRTASLPAIGDIDEEQGEFWVENPFMMPMMGENLSAYEKNRVYLNNKGTSFIEVSSHSRADIDADSRGAIPADFNRDGRPDILVSSIGGGPLRLFLNRIDDGNSRITLDLHGTESNALGIGAKVIIEAGGQKIYREMFPHSGFMGSQPTELNIGLGKVDKIDRLTIQWPSGQDSEFVDLPVNQRITVTEGAGQPVVGPFAPSNAAGKP